MSASAPNPVFTPYTGAPPLSALTTTERLVSIRLATSRAEGDPGLPVRDRHDVLHGQRASVYHHISHDR